MSNTNRLPPLKPDILLIDPAWKFECYSEKGEDRSATKHYKCSLIDLMAQIPISDLLLDHTAVFMWVTDPMIEQAMELIPRWGLRYSTVGFYWHKECKKSKKDAFGNGYVTRANTEQCWFLRKKNSKKMLPRVDRSVPRLQHTEETLESESVRAKIGKHSEKPELIQDKIEQLFGDTFTLEGESRPLIKMELFARRHRPGWVCMGNELDGMLHDESVPIYLQGEYVSPL